MKLDMILNELDYKPSKSPPRLGIYLTNSLEEGEREVRDLFMAQWLTREAKEANVIKRQSPIMCVIGNPPYSGHSSNSGDWITGLIDPYKMEPGGKVRLKEKNSKWINDDYVKFIRFAEHMIQKNGEGILGFITNHGYLDNPTFRGMRWHLLNTFDKVLVLDLHGNAKKKEITPDGKPDKNVFDIQQGVAIVVGIKKGTAKDDKPLARVYHADLWGERKDKYSQLETISLSNKVFVESQPKAPQYYFQTRDYALENAYLDGFAINEFFVEGVLGFQTHRDKFAVNETRSDIEKKLNDYLDQAISDEELHKKYGTRDNRDWKLSEQRSKLRNDNYWQEKLTACLYRPFDIRQCHLDYVMMDYPRTEIIRNVLNKDNLCLLASRQLAVEGYQHCLVTNLPAESCAVSLKTKEQNQVFPIYAYPAEGELDQSRRINFDERVWKKLRKIAKHKKYGSPDEIATLDYIYGVLHCPVYRETYAEFLKADFPHIPWPATSDEFWDVSDKGSNLRRLHLMEPAIIGATPFPFKGEGEALVEKLKYEDGKVWVNKSQYFDEVPPIAWEFFIGGYQPAQKWLKDRKGKQLSFEDVKHYQRIIKILCETDRIMKTIKMTIKLNT
jgi:predicted helicase